MALKNRNRILSLFLVLQIILISVLSKFPNFIENNYANGIYKYISIFLRHLFGWIPFSIGDIIYLILIILLIISIYKLFRNINKKEIIFQIFAGLSIFYFFFYFFWGLNYSRKPINNALQLEEEKYDIERLKEFTDLLISKTVHIQIQLTSNDSLPVIVPYTKNEIINLTANGYQNLGQKFPQFQYIRTSLKKSMFSLPLTYMGFAGYFNPLTGEAQVDYLIPKTSLPITCSHEIAHQLGIASESEASFIGYLAANFHDDLYFQYSANLSALRYALSDIYRYDPKLYRSYIEKLPKGIILNFRELKEFWIKYENVTEPLFKLFYSNYLKANQQKDGLESYNRMIDLLIAYDKKYQLK